MNQWMDLAERVLDGAEVTDQEALAILNCPDEDLLLLMHAAFHIRKRFYGKKVKLNMIMNAKSGLCPENCGYCSQSSISKAPIESYRMVDKHILLKGAKRAHDLNIGTYVCPYIQVVGAFCPLQQYMLIHHPIRLDRRF